MSIANFRYRVGAAREALVKAPFVNACPFAFIPRSAVGLLRLLGGAALLGTTTTARAQVTSTVRDNEFRSRWADYQVDRPQTLNSNTANNPAQTAEPDGLLAAFGRSYADLFRNGPLQTRLTLSSGWEYSDEQVLTSQRHTGGSDNSFFVAPSIGLFYNNQFGPATISARYSGGYVYYLDHDYVAARDGGGIFSNTAALDLQVEGTRSAVTSNAALSYGDGNDIESGALRTQFTISETATASYLLSTFTRLGVTGGINYNDYSGGGVNDTDVFSDTASVYVEYAYSPKTRGRLELAAGQELQNSDVAASSGVNGSADRYYYQALLSADYLPTAKLSLSVGAGYGFQENSDVIGQGRSGSHPIYRVTVQYAPTVKTTASLRFGYEGVDVAPSFSLLVGWQFRQNTSASLSLYQNTNFSTYETNQNLLTRGALAGVQQRFFGRVDVSLSGGVEQSEGYGRQLPGQAPFDEDPYLFAGVTGLWQINSYLALQAYYRGYTGAAGAAVQQSGLQSRASVSLRLTF